MDWSLRAVRQHLAAHNVGVVQDLYPNGQQRFKAYKLGQGPIRLSDQVHAPDAETLYVRALRRLT